MGLLQILLMTTTKPFKCISDKVEYLRSGYIMRSFQY